MKTTNWNPWHGCKKISDGCKHCYVYRTDARFEKDSSIVTKTQSFSLPISKNQKREYKIPSGQTVYTCFTSDFLVQDADPWRAEAWRMIKERSDLFFIFITKRIDRLQNVLPNDWEDGYDNVMIGSTCENQKMADYRLPIFLSLPIKHRFIVCEPLLSYIDLMPYLIKEKIEQVVVGGESGENARLCDYAWVLDIRKQCLDREVTFWFKQTGANFKKDDKVYRIPRKLQHSQAKKANINLYR